MWFNLTLSKDDVYHLFMILICDRTKTGFRHFAKIILSHVFYGNII